MKKKAKPASLGWCDKPDRDVPGIKCGYPLPCPWHTLVVDLTGAAPTVGVPQVLAQQTPPLELALATTRVGQVADAIAEALPMPKKKRGRRG